MNIYGNKFLLRFKEKWMEDWYEEERMRTAYSKFKIYNIGSCIAVPIGLLGIYISGNLTKGEEYEGCEVNDYFVDVYVAPAILLCIQIDTLLMKCRLFTAIRGILTLFGVFVGVTEITIYQYIYIPSQVMGFASCVFLSLFAIIIGHDIIKYWERAAITFAMGVIYYYIRHIVVKKLDIILVIGLCAIILSITCVIFHTFDKSEREKFYLYQRIRNKEQEWKKLFGSIPIGMLIRNKAKEVKYLNQAAGGIILSKNLEEENFNVQLTQNDCAIIKNIFELLDIKWKNREGKQLIEYEIINESRENIFLEINRQNIEFEDEKCKIYIMKDISLSKKIELDIKKHAKEKDMFFASMSHELRNPLNALLGAIDILQKSNYEYDKEILETAGTCGDTLHNLIGNILDVSKIENHKLDITPSEGNIVECITKISQMMKTIAKKKGLYLKFDPDIDIPKYFIFDNSRLNQVLINLIANSIKFTVSGGVKIILSYIPNYGKSKTKSAIHKIHQNDYFEFNNETVFEDGYETEVVPERNKIENFHISINPFFSYTDEVTERKLNTEPEKNKSNIESNTYRSASLHEENKEEDLDMGTNTGIDDLSGFIKIHIIDTGIGISQQNIKNLFKPFSQADNSRKKFGGTGLGLWISKNIIKMMGGSIKIVSDVGVGSSFVIVLPLSQYKYIENHKNLSTGETSIVKGKRFLLVDDEDYNRKIMGQLVESYGGYVYLAANGQAALEIFEQINQDSSSVSGDYVDIILTDLRMPIMNGQNMILAIRKYETMKRLPRTPIIVISGNPSEEERAKCLDILGANAFISKPFTIAMLENALLCIRNAKNENLLPIELIRQGTKLNLEFLILLVDDDVFCSQITLKQLKVNGLGNVLSVYSAFETTEALNNILLNNKLDHLIILLDSHLPDATGPELADQIFHFWTNSNHNTSLKIFALSGDSLEEQKELYANCSFTIEEFFQKPVIFPILVETIKKCLCNEI